MEKKGKRIKRHKKRPGNKNFFTSEFQTQKTSFLESRISLHHHETKNVYIIKK